MSKFKFKKKTIIFGMKYFGFLTVLWYNITLFFTKKKQFLLKEQDSINRIPELLQFGTKYKPDPRIDVLYHPTYVQKLLETNKYKHFDCEDHAGFWVATIKKSNLAKKVYFGILMMAKENKISGHVVCVYQDFDGKYWWGDYHYPIQIVDKWDFAEQSATAYGATAFGSALIEVKGLKKHDTPILGKYKFHQP